MQKEDIKFRNSTVFEGMVSIRSIIKGIDLNINTRSIEKVLYSTEKKHKNEKTLKYLTAVSSKYNFELVETNEEYLSKISLGTSHGGIIAIGSDRHIPEISNEIPIVDNGFYALIDGIEDPYNFGYALRSLYACGIDGIIMPKRNWMSAAGVVCRSSAGASELLPMYVYDDIKACASVFKSHGYSVVCADERTDNILGMTSLPLPILFIVGGEKRGISRSVLDIADILVKIDYKREFNASLSAASATTMFAYEIMRQSLK